MREEVTRKRPGKYGKEGRSDGGGGCVLRSRLARSVDGTACKSTDRKNGCKFAALRMIKKGAREGGRRQKGKGEEIGRDKGGR